MRSRKATMNLSDMMTSVQLELIQLQSLNKNDASLLQALICAIPHDQVYYAKGTVMDVICQDKNQRVSFSHDLFLGFRQDGQKALSVHVVERAESLQDVVRYQSLGRLVSEGQALKYIPLNQPMSVYFLDFDQTQPRSSLFGEVVIGLLQSHPKSAKLYQQGSVVPFQMNGCDAELHIKYKSKIQVRPAKKNPDEMRVEFMVRYKLGAGAYGSVSKAPTYRLMMDRFNRTQHDRVIKVIPRRVFSDGSQESREDFKVRVLSEERFSAAFGLKPKPVVINEQCAYLTFREVSGLNVESWLLDWDDANCDGIFMGATLAYRAALGCLKALADLHAQGIIHGDMKANNLMIDCKSDDEVDVRVIDAGAASYVDQMVLFAAHKKYASPESASAMKGQPGYIPFNSEASDVYALGVVLADIFGFDYDTRYQLTGEPSRVSGLTDAEVADIKALLKGLLEPTPAYRYTAKGAYKQLSEYFDGHAKAKGLSASSSPERRSFK